MRKKINGCYLNQHWGDHNVTCVSKNVDNVYCSLRLWHQTFGWYHYFIINIRSIETLYNIFDAEILLQIKLWWVQKTQLVKIKQDILQKHLHTNRSIFVSYGSNQLFRIFRDFYVSGMQDAEVTKSLWWSWSSSNCVVPEHIHTTPTEGICCITPPPLPSGFSKKDPQMYPPPSPPEFPKFSHTPWNYCYLLSK